MFIKVVNKSGYPTPSYETDGSAGMDIHAKIDENEVTLRPGEYKLIHTGLYVELPEGYELQIRPRSGLALKHGVTVLNTPGTIDSDYRGEIGVILINHSQKPYEIYPGERIAQMVVSRYERAEFEEVEQLDDTERGAGGFGHTGK